VRICSLLIRMALRASDLLRRRFVDQALHVLVAIDATEHSAVDGMLQLVFIHEQADLAAVRIFTQCGVGVAGETVFVFQLLLSACGRGPYKQQYEKNKCEGSSGCVHAYEEMLRRKCPQ